MHHAPRTALYLGWAGLTPFVVAPPLLVLDGMNVAFVATALMYYGLSILCFLSGAWWGIALLRRSASMLVASNVMVLLAWAGLLFADTGEALLLLAGLLVLTLLIERKHPLFERQPAYYRVLRLRLTSVAAPSLVLVAALLAP